MHLWGIHSDTPQVLFNKGRKAHEREDTIEEEDWYTWV